jgi:O-antigen ligase
MQFGEYHYLTAHNSYLLALAELGFPGLFLFTLLIYLSTKIPLTALRRYSGDGGAVLGELARPMRAWAMGLSAAFIGLAIGISFLSFAYHAVLWIYLGLSGALYLTARRHDPDFRVRIGVKDLALVGVLDCALIVGMYVLTRAMLA